MVPTCLKYIPLATRSQRWDSQSLRKKISPLCVKPPPTPLVNMSGSTTTHRSMLDHSLPSPRSSECTQGATPAWLRTLT